MAAGFRAAPIRLPQRLTITVQLRIADEDRDLRHGMPRFVSGSYLYVADRLHFDIPQSRRHGSLQ